MGFRRTKIQNFTTFDLAGKAKKIIYNIGFIVHIMHVKRKTNESNDTNLLFICSVVSIIYPFINIMIKIGLSVYYTIVLILSY